MYKLNPEKYLEYVLDTLSAKGLTDQNKESICKMKQIRLTMRLYHYKSDLLICVLLYAYK